MKTNDEIIRLSIDIEKKKLEFLEQKFDMPRKKIIELLINCLLDIEIKDNKNFLKLFTQIQL